MGHSDDLDPFSSNPKVWVTTVIKRCPSSGHQLIVSLVVFVSFVSPVLTECPSPGTLIEELVVSYFSETRLAPPFRSP